MSVRLRLYTVYVMMPIPVIKERLIAYIKKRRNAYGFFCL